MNAMFKIVSSLEKVFYNDFETLKELHEFSMLKNEIFSFQLVGKATEIGGSNYRAKIKINSALSDCIKIYSVEYVPSMYPCNFNCTDDDYLKKEPGLFPDTLFPIKNNEILLCENQSRAFWITIEPDSKLCGEHPIEIEIFDGENNKLYSDIFTIDIIDQCLPKQELLSTGWFHTDCLAALHNVKMLSEEHFDIIKKYIKVYKKFGHNMILTPVFTPPLDTKIGGERPTIQLVRVSNDKGKYSFDFTDLKRWIDICLECGIEYFEISHLFTQWGAYFTPKIMVTRDGEYVREFGWDVASDSEKYISFLKCFLPQLTSFLREQGIADKCIFHISDEPCEKQIDSYKKAKQIVYPYISDFKIIDALSEYEFYEKKIIEHPVVATTGVNEFLDKDVPNLWVYYCCCQDKKVANRFMAMPSYRNRILGCQLYKNNIEGFLQWGFNFWYSQYSINQIDPYNITDAGYAFPSGDAFVVYPLSPEGEVIKSFRLFVFNEGLQDLRALKLCEKKIGREKTMALLEEVSRFDQYPRSNDYILDLRRKINSIIKEN